MNKYVTIHSSEYVKNCNSDCSVRNSDCSVRNSDCKVDYKLLRSEYAKQKINVFMEFDKEEYHENNTQLFRDKKMNVYRQKRSQFVHNIMKKFQLTIQDQLNQLYDLFHEYSTTMVMDEPHYWKCMKLLGIFEETCDPIYSLLFEAMCTNTKKGLIIYEFIISILMFTEQSDYFSTLKYNTLRSFSMKNEKLQKINK